MANYPTDSKGGRKAIKYRQLGRQDVIEFIKKELPEIYGDFNEWTVWKEQCKEWGIDESTR